MLFFEPLQKHANSRTSTQSTPHESSYNWPASIRPSWLRTWASCLLASRPKPISKSPLNPSPTPTPKSWTCFSVTAFPHPILPHCQSAFLCVPSTLLKQMEGHTLTRHPPISPPQNHHIWMCHAKQGSFVQHSAGCLKCQKTTAVENTKTNLALWLSRANGNTKDFLSKVRKWS